MKYVYKAKKGLNDIVQGTIEAASQDIAVAKIVERGLVPVLVQIEDEYVADEASPEKGARFKPIFGERVTREHIYFFTKKLRVLLKSQVPILDSLYILEGQINNKRFRSMMKDIIGNVRDGLSFSDSLSKYPRYFSPLYISIIKAGEASGKLDFSLEHIAKYLDDEKQVSSKVKSSLAYPAVMITVGCLTVVFIITFVVPRLQVLFEDLVDQLPFVTKVLLSVSLFFSKYWLFMLLSLVALGVFLYYTRGAHWQRAILYQIKRRTPILKEIMYNQSLARFSRALSILLSSGVSILESLRIAIPLVDDLTAQEELKVAYKEILEGGGLEESFRNNVEFLPDLFTKMVAIGEASGRLEEILGELSESYADEVSMYTKIVTSLIEPIAILVVGGILGFIVIAVLLPIFEISFLVS